MLGFLIKSLNFLGKHSYSFHYFLLLNTNISSGNISSKFISWIFQYSRNWSVKVRTTSYHWWAHLYTSSKPIRQLGLIRAECSCKLTTPYSLPLDLKVMNSQLTSNLFRYVVIVSASDFSWAESLMEVRLFHFSLFRTLLSKLAISADRNDLETAALRPREPITAEVSHQWIPVGSN